MEAAPKTPSRFLDRKDASAGGNARTAAVYAAALAAGLALRIGMLLELFQVQGDSLVYGGIAKNLLLRGAYAYNSQTTGALHITLIRLPGYPLFLAACFKLFGMENYAAAVYIQIGLDLVACVLLADFVRRIAPPALKHKAAMATLWLAALCPFTSDYSTEPLTESLTIFAIVLALWAMARFKETPGWKYALWFTFAVTLAAILRPDGPLVALALAPALVMGLSPGAIARKKLARITAVCVVLTLAPFGAWAWRNWRTFHVFQPLAPRTTSDPGELVTPGWERWVKTWSLDYISTDEIYWHVPDEPLNVDDLPARAFDTPAQKAETEAIAAAYENNDEKLSPALDARFARLAEQRIRDNPLRYYLWLPLGRLADMTLRPRVENMNIDLDWWVYNNHPDETVFSWAYAGLNVLYLALGIAGLCMRPRFWKPMVAYIVMRCALLLTIGGPEDRYTLEFFPMLCAWGGVAIAAAMRRVRTGAVAGVMGRTV
jgi:Dolichyl-phosphate-mannose-protein mannosyltransferase